MGVSETACGRGGKLDHCSLLINTPSPRRPGANQEPCRPPPHHPLQQTIQCPLRGKILGRMSGPREHFPLQKTIQSTLRSNIFGHICWPCEHFPLQRTIQTTRRGNILGHMCGPREHFPWQKKNNTKYISEQHIWPYVLALRTLSLAKKQYKVHFGATYWVTCVGHANTFPCKKQYKVHFGATYLVIFVVPASTFPCKEQYKVHFGATYWVIFVGPASTLYCFFCKGKCSRGQQI